MYLPLLALPAESAYPQSVSAMVPIAISFMVTFIALIYMAAQFFKKPEWEQMAGSELYQVLVSLIIFISIFTLKAGVDASVQQLSGADDIFDYAQMYLQKVSYTYMVPNLVNLEVFKLQLQHVAGITYRLGPQPWSVTWPAFPGVETIEKAVDFTLTMMTPVTASIIAQQIGMQFLKAVCPLLIAVGVLLRIFAPTRDAGSFMIVSGFAFSFIFPFTYYIHQTVAQYMYNNAVYGTPQGEGETLDYSNLGSENAASIKKFIWFLRPETNLFYPIRLLSFAMLQAMFLPALSMVVTVTFIKSTLKFVSQKLD
ncbi:Uncharacterised protein [Candidatus Anstonella stagnisolia]|nr:Uncharacterised protein [Candidatus Anstonella stagnisolia]